jgi:hypothetical protein
MGADVKFWGPPANAVAPPLLAMFPIRVAEVGLRVVVEPLYGPKMGSVLATFSHDWRFMDVAPPVKAPAFVATWLLVLMSKPPIVSTNVAVVGGGGA